MSEKATFEAEVKAVEEFQKVSRAFRGGIGHDSV